MILALVYVANFFMAGWQFGDVTQGKAAAGTFVMIAVHLVLASWAGHQLYKDLA